MQYTNESEILKALDMESWRNLSKEKFLGFLAMMPEMDTEVALKLIGQLPEFAKFASAVLEDVRRAFKATLSANDHSMEDAHQIGMERLAILKAELNKDLSPGDRLRLLAEIRDVHERALAKDSDNKKFLGEQFTKMAAAALAAVVLSLVFVGARVVLQSGGGRAIKH